MALIYTPTASRGALAGEQIDKGLSSALDYMSKQKAEQLQARQKAALKQQEQEQQMEALKELGVDPQLALLDPQLAKSVMKQQSQEKLLEQFPQTFGQQQQQAQGGLADGLPPGRRRPEEGGEVVAEEGYVVSPTGEIEGEEGLLVAPWEEQMRAPTVTGQEVAAAGAAHPALGKGVEFQGAQQLQQQKIALQKSEHDYKRNQKWIESLEEQGEAAKETMQALHLANDAVNSGDIGRWSLANLAESLPKHGFLGGLRRMLTSSSAQQLTSATKDLLKSLKAIFGARPTNLDVTLLEQMFPRIGQSEAANRMAVKIARIGPESAMMKQSIFDQIQEKNPRASYTQLKRATKKAFNKWSDTFFDGVNDDIRAINNGLVPVTSPEGEKLYIREKNMKAALADGYQWR